MIDELLPQFRHQSGEIGSLGETTLFDAVPSSFKEQFLLVLLYRQSTIRELTTMRMAQPSSSSKEYRTCNCRLYGNLMNKRTLPKLFCMSQLRASCAEDSLSLLLVQ